MKSLIALIIMVSTAVSFSADNVKKPAMTSTSIQTVDIQVTEKGFEFNSQAIRPNQETQLKIKRVTDSTCATKIKIPSKKIVQDLPLNKEVLIKLGKLTKGELHFSCGMDMVTGLLTIK